jgi:hypothetical protein
MERVAAVAPTRISTRSERPMGTPFPGAPEIMRTAVYKAQNAYAVSVQLAPVAFTSRAIVVHCVVLLG